MIKIIVLCLLHLLGLAVSFELTDEEYYQLPDVFDSDNYEKCLSQRHNAFCAGVFELAASGPSQVYDVLKKLSENDQVYFNHSRIHRAICLGPKSSCPINDDLVDSFEGCVDQRMSRDYGLIARLMKLYFCRRSGDKLEMDGVSKSFIAFLIVVVLLNAIGSAYDVFIKDSNGKGKQWLIAFSIPRNWEKLTSPSKVSDPRLQKLVYVHGFRAMISLLTFFGHFAVLSLLNFPANSRFIEKLFCRPLGAFYRNMTLLLQVFILISNFLLSYTMLIFSEKYKLSFKMLPQMIIHRVVRIQPMQLMTIGIVANVAPHLGDGPYWYRNMVEDSKVYRDTWWHHALFINNFFEPKASSLLQTWYLAADFQQYIISCVIMLWIIKKGLDLEYVLSRLLVVSLLGVFSLVFILDFESDFKVIKPENFINVFAEDRSFKWFYQSFWGSLPTVIMGLLFGAIYYRLKKENIDLTKNKMFVVMAYSSELLLFVWAFGPWFLVLDPSSFGGSLFTTLNKPVFSVIILFIGMGSFFELKGPLMTVARWPGWLVLSRLSLGTLLMHFTVIKLIVGIRPYSSLSFTGIILDSLCASAVTYLVVLPLALLVEYPAAALFNIIINYEFTKQTKKPNKIQ